MAAKHQAASAVKKGMSIRAAADKFGIHPSTLSGHLDIINRLQGCTTEEKERLVMCAVQAVTVGRLTTRRAARVYGVPEATLRRRVKNPNLRRGRPTLLTSAEEDTLKQVLIRLGKPNCGLTRRALQRLLMEIGIMFGNILNRTEFQEALVKKAADMKAKRALKTINRKVVSATKAAIVKNDKTKPKKRV